MRQLILILLILIFCPHLIQAQILNKIRNKVRNKIEHQIEERIVEEVSDAIAKRAYKSIDNGFDNLIKDSFPGDTTATGEIDWDKVNAASSAMMESLDASDRLPDFYAFDLYVDVKVTDYDNEVSECRMFYSKDKEQFGIEQIEDGTSNFVVMDIAEDIVAIYRNENGKKTVQAIQNMMKMAAGNYNNSSAATKMASFKINKTGATRNIANYYTEEYKGENDKEDIVINAAPKFPINWKDSYGGFITQFTPETYSESANKIKGMVLYSENKLKENPNKICYWEVTEVFEKTYRINNADYDKVHY